MLKQLQKRKSEGFTIIEVLVVLAIAGLIMVVVFLAVPALNRSGRNNGLNGSARSILAAVHAYANNNGGTPPATQTSAAPTGGAVTIGSTGNTETVKVDGNVVGFLINGSAITATGASASPIGTMQVITGTTAVCNPTASGIAGTGSARSYVVLYVAEGSGSTNLLKCVGN